MASITTLPIAESYISMVEPLQVLFRTRYLICMPPKVPEQDMPTSRFMLPCHKQLDSPVFTFPCIRIHAVLDRNSSATQDTLHHRVGCVMLLKPAVTLRKSLRKGVRSNHVIMESSKGEGVMKTKSCFLDRSTSCAGIDAGLLGLKPGNTACKPSE